MSEQAEHLESFLTRRRAYELQVNPVRGNFDVARLQETHRYLFQDLPKFGLWKYNVQPREFRQETQTWCKDRILASIEDKNGKPDVSFTSYSRMDSKAIKRLNEILKEANPESLQRLGKAEFVEKISKLYSDLDYIHPFREGNSRTLRTFTGQLAKESGYELNWKKFSGEKDRDLLYIARDRGLAERASRDADHHPVFLAKALYDAEWHQGYPSLAQLLDKTVEQARIAPRHDLNKSQAQIHVAATERMAENLEVLKKNPALAEKSEQALEKLAYYRGILQEDVKRETPEAQQAALTKFDRAAENPAFVERLEKSDQAQEATKEPEQRQERKDEQSL